MTVKREMTGGSNTFNGGKSDKKVGMPERREGIINTVALHPLSVGLVVVWVLDNGAVDSSGVGFHTLQLPLPTTSLYDEDLWYTCRRQTLKRCRPGADEGRTQM